MSSSPGARRSRPTCRSTSARALSTRTTDGYGRGGAELAQVLIDLEGVEPLLRRSADLVLDGTVPVEGLADAVLVRSAERAP